MSDNPHPTDTRVGQLLRQRRLQRGNGLRPRVEVFLDPGAGGGDERARVAPAVVVEGLRDQLLPGTGLAQNERWNIVSGHPPSELDLPSHGVTSMKDLLESGGGLERGAGESLCALITPPEKLWKEIAGKVEDEIDWFQTPLL